MFDREELEDYRPKTPQVDSVEGDKLLVFCGDDLPPLGSAVAFVSGGEEERVYGTIQGHLGSGRIEVWLPLRPDWVVEGCTVEVTESPAAFAPPGDEPIEPGPHLLRPRLDGDIEFWPSAPEMVELDGHRPALPLGIDALDNLAPFCRGGINLVVDASGDDGALRRLAGKVSETLAPKTILTLASEDLLSPGESTTWRISSGELLNAHITAIQATIALSPALRRESPALALVELPAPEPFAESQKTPDAPPAGLPQIIDRLGRHLVSTKDQSLTTLLHLRLSSELAGLQEIIETLNLGDVDAVIHIDSDGRFDPERSTSRAEIDEERATRQGRLLQTLGLARRAREKSMIFDESDLSDDERRALKDAPLLRPVL